MPYITPDRRDALERDPESFPENPGELNFIFSSIIDEYLTRKGKSYQNINDVLGALEGSKLELYRRIASPYEDIKIRQNGDVYSSELTGK